MGPYLRRRCDVVIDEIRHLFWSKQNKNVKTPDFISPQMWPPNSPDLNPVDYEIWSVLQERVYRSRIRDADHLRARLVEEWQLFDHAIIDRAVKQWRPRLRSCVRERGGHFEHQL